MTLDLAHLDGRIGEAWSGDVPNGSHVNVVLARRGSPTAAAAVAAFSLPGPGHAPVLVCLGAGNAVRPATIMTNKATAEKVPHQRITWGAAQLGIGQAVMDAVVEGALPAEQADDIVLLVAVWVDPDANDPTAVRLANREAMRRALDEVLAGVSAEQIAEIAAGRDSATNAFYDGE
ncbi:MAG: 5,6,7,8-tetrahydromethanopterin hydro-lyase [Gaiellales bacterium]|jgi:5,6,7,8-tetrahydromethanopterin hydro-lyase|nr:5,6,7,8-tetrahydromethanopterin hydro-lyase [Gaiellales bacterium]